MHDSGLQEMAKNTDEELRKQFLKKRIAVLMGGMSSERDISLKTGGAILHALQGRGYTAVALDADRNIAESLKANRIDIAFIALHGALGEDGTVQGLLELLGIAYTGSGVLASAVSINKVATKKMLAYHGLPTPAFQVVCAEDGDAGACGHINHPAPAVCRQASGRGVNHRHQHSPGCRAHRRGGKPGSAV